jgi:hypothetical protein
MHAPKHALAVYVCKFGRYPLPPGSCAQQSLLGGETGHVNVAQVVVHHTNVPAFGDAAPSPDGGHEHQARQSQQYRDENTASHNFR